MEIIRDYKKNITNSNEMVTFGHPELLTSGTYFTKILYNNRPLYIQTPKCKTKNGFIKSNKKIYTELLFQNTEEDMLGWFEYLDEYCKDFMLLKSTDWFNSTLTKEDIDTLWISTFKLYKSGKNILIKVNIPIDNNIPVIKIYDESEKTKHLDDVTELTTVQTILEICGIKFTSKTYQLHVELKQMMIRNNNIIEHPLLNTCLIKPIYIDTPTTEFVVENIDDNIKITPPINNGEISESLLLLSNNIDTPSHPETSHHPPQPTLYNEDDVFIEDNASLDLEPINMDNLGMKHNNKEEDITIKDPNVIYMEMYTDRITNAKKLLFASKNLFQEAKQIKEKYKLDITENINEYIL
jgi:hypothetical protein